MSCVIMCVLMLAGDFVQLDPEHAQGHLQHEFPGIIFLGTHYISRNFVIQRESVFANPHLYLIWHYSVIGTPLMLSIE